jgi:hypothetical protein
MDVSVRNAEKIQTINLKELDHCVDLCIKVRILLIILCHRLNILIWCTDVKIAKAEEIGSMIVT